MSMVVKTAGDPGAMTSAVRAAIRDVDSSQPLYDVRPMTVVIERSLTGQKLNVLLVGSFAALALLLASIGLYSVISQLTDRRSREFGIRLAVGAKPADLLRIVLKEGHARALFGVIVGVAISAAVTRLLADIPHGVRTFDAVTYFLAVGLLLLVVLAASYAPAWRAAKIDPALILRCE